MYQKQPLHKAVSSPICELEIVLFCMMPWSTPTVHSHQSNGIKFYVIRLHAYIIELEDVHIISNSEHEFRETRQVSTYFQFTNISTEKYIKCNLLTKVHQVIHFSDSNQQGILNQGTLANHIL